MTFIAIKMVGLEKVEETLYNLEVNLPRALRKSTKEFMEHLAEKIREAAQSGKYTGYKHVNTGYLASAKGTRVVEMAEGQFGIAMPFYTKYLQKGTRPHYIPRMGKTMMWAKKHGMSFKNMRTMIARRGTMAHPFTDKVFVNEYDMLRMKGEKAINRLLRSKGRSKK